MLDHHIQRSIIYQLAFTQSARFSELQPDDVENKLFNYYLKKVIAAGYVVKDENGLYTLTPDGRRLGTGAIEKQQRLVIERAHSVLFLVVRRKLDGAWLFYRRGTYPLLGYSGFMHCNPSSTLEAPEAARKEFTEKTGLSGEFTALGGGYFRILEGEKIESFTHFTLLYCDDAEGELLSQDHRADYFWVESPDTDDTNLLPSTHVLKEMYLAQKPFFVEKTFTI